MKPHPSPYLHRIAPSPPRWSPGLACRRRANRFRTKIIKIIVPIQAGGAADAGARIVAAGLQTQVKQIRDRRQQGRAAAS